MKIGVVIVTYNRIAKLEEALLRFDTQTFLPEYVLVVNNASTDGTFTLLDKWEKNKNSNYKRYVINCKHNTGGSGGFYTALSQAAELDADWIWVSDDDAFPENDVLAKVKDYITTHEREKIVAICSKVCNHGEIDLAHRRRLKKGLLRIYEYYVPVKEYNNKSFEMQEFSYVGVVINKEALKRVGSTQKDFFINQDDTEHSLRLSKEGKIICVPDITVHHDTNKEISGIDWKKYYQIRNRYYAYKYNFPARYSKFYYFETQMKYYIKKIFRLRTTEELGMYKRALMDIRNNTLGMSEIYKPGWKPQQ